MTSPDVATVRTHATSRYWTTGAAAALIAGPALLLIPNLMGLNQVGSDESTLVWVRAHEDRYLLGVAILLCGFGLLQIGGIRMATTLTDRGATLGRVGGTLYLVGLTASLVTTSTYLLSARLITLPGVDPAVAHVIKEKGDADGGLGVFLLVGVLFFVGAILLMVGLGRAGRVPTWVAVVGVVGVLATAVADIAGAATPELVVALLLLWAGFAATGRASLSWRGVGEA